MVRVNLRRLEGPKALTIGSAGKASGSERVGPPPLA